MPDRAKHGNPQPARPGKLSLRGKVLLSLVSFSVGWLFLEVAFRLAGFNFDRLDAELKKLPIYVQKPSVPLDPVFFRRDGPAKWTGQVLHSALLREKGYNSCYENEPVQSIQYDHEGFRNPPELTDWEIAVVGDSFVESGYLSHDDLLTSALGRELGLRVKNLGASWSGPFSHTAYLRRFGKAPSARDAFLVFFEGNDLGDLHREHQALERHRRTGARARVAVKNANSLTRALWLHLKNLMDGDAAPRFAWADLVIDGRQTAVTVDYVPPAPSELSAEHIRMLNEALQGWANTCREMGMNPWLVYMPAKRRVFAPFLTVRPDQPPSLTEWKPNDLPEFVGRIAEEHGIRVIDLTRDLTGATREGAMPYNALFDSHLSREGSLLSGKIIAREYRARKQN